MEQSVSYMELVECQSIAVEAIAYYKIEFGSAPVNASEAEYAVRWACNDGRLSCDKSWLEIEPYLDLIVDHIGFIVEE